MRSSQLQLWKTIAPIFIMLGYLPAVCGNLIPQASPPPPLGTCDENSPIDSAVVPKQTGQQGAKGDNGKNNPCAKKKDDPVFFCKSVQDGVLEPTPSCSPRCVTHTRTRTGTHAHAHAHVHANKALQPVRMPCVARPNGRLDDEGPGVSAVPNELYGR